MKILALDLGTKTGVCYDGTPDLWDLTTKKFESSGMKLMKLKSMVRTIHQTMGIDLLVFETPGGANYSGVIGIATMMGVVIEYCEEHKIEYKGYAQKQIKKFATGNGNAGKPLMVKTVQERFRYKQVTDDNTADAICIYFLAKFELEEL